MGGGKKIEHPFDTQTWAQCQSPPAEIYRASRARL
nr:MAG TPA: hypothetical protein [Caudoviricetes sp.]